MTHEELNTIEKTFSITLPAFYKHFMVYEIYWLERAIENYTLCNNVEYIIEMNTWVTGLLDPDRHWPKDKFIIGDLGGNFFLIDLYSGEETVFYIDHEDAPEEEIPEAEIDWDTVIIPKYANLQEFKEWMLDYYG